MFKEGKIGVYEAVSLMVITLMSKTFFSSPSQVFQKAGNAGWLQLLISGSTSIILFSLLYLLMKRFPGQDYVAILQEVFGTIIGKILLILVVMFFTLYTAISLREFTDILKIIVLPLTPISVIFVSFLTVILIISYLGLEPLARTTAFFSIWWLIAFILILILPIENYRTYRLFPLFGYGLGQLFYSGITRISAWGEIFLLVLISNSLQGIKEFKKIGYTSMSITVLGISISFTCYTLAFPYYVAVEPVSSYFQMTRLISYGRFFQRLEAIFIFLWVISALINSCFTFYVSVTTYAKTFRLTEYKPLLIPFAVLTFTLAILPTNFSWVATKAVLFLRTYTWIPAFGVPSLALLMAIIRGKKGELKEA